MNFIAMGSGSVAAIGILERDFKSGMTLEEGQELVTRAISAGIIQDLGSGSQVDTVVITKDSSKMTRNVLTIGKRETEKREYTFAENNIGKLQQPLNIILTQNSHSWRTNY
jgi:20S proteasome subunit beta 2